jgi:hypothetical protein
MGKREVGGSTPHHVVGLLQWRQGVIDECDHLLAKPSLLAAVARYSAEDTQARPW